MFTLEMCEYLKFQKGLTLKSQNFVFKENKGIPVS